jgi:hypothetical protein
MRVKPFAALKVVAPHAHASASLRKCCDHLPLVLQAGRAPRARISFRNAATPQPTPGLDLHEQLSAWDSTARSAQKLAQLGPSISVTAAYDGCFASCCVDLQAADHSPPVACRNLRRQSCAILVGRGLTARPLQRSRRRCALHNGKCVKFQTLYITVSRVARNTQGRCLHFATWQIRAGSVQLRAEGTVYKRNSEPAQRNCLEREATWQRSHGGNLQQENSGSTRALVKTIF